MVKSIRFDPETGVYLCPETGEIWLPEELPDRPGYAVEKVQSTPVFVDLLAEIEEKLLDCISACKTQGWKQQILNPDIEIGQTVPQTEYCFEEHTDRFGITQRYASEYARSRNNIPLIYQRVEGPKVYNPSYPNAVDIEHKIHPSFVTEEDLPQPENKLGLIDLFYGLYKLLLALKSSPNAPWIPWIGALIDFVVNDIQIHNGNRTCGQIDILDLLSTVAANKNAVYDIGQLLRATEARLKTTLQKLKLLYRKFGRRQGHHTRPH